MQDFRQARRTPEKDFQEKEPLGESGDLLSDYFSGTIDRRDSLSCVFVIALAFVVVLTQNENGDGDSTHGADDDNGSDRTLLWTPLSYPTISAQTGIPCQ
jgi:hypothetical protein